MKIELPPDYSIYFEGDEVIVAGFADGFPEYFILWHPDEIEKRNQDLNAVAFAPGFLGFGSNDGGEMLAFDANGTVYSLSMTSMDWHAILVADSWTEFKKRIRNKGLP